VAGVVAGAALGGVAGIVPRFADGDAGRAGTLSGVSSPGCGFFEHAVKRHVPITRKAIAAEIRNLFMAFSPGLSRAAFYWRQPGSFDAHKFKFKD
jgi:hypothetical protein